MSSGRCTNDRATQSTPSSSAKVQVAAVLFGQRRNRQDRADDADALPFGNAPSCQDTGGGRLCFGLLDLQPDLAVVHQQMDAGRQGREDLGVR